MPIKKKKEENFLNRRINDKRRTARRRGNKLRILGSLVAAKDSRKRVAIGRGTSKGRRDCLLYK